MDQKQKSKPLSALIEHIPEIDEASEDSDSDLEHHPLEDMPFLFPQADHRQGQIPQHQIGENS